MTPNRRTSEAVDHYLKAILELGGAGEVQVATNALAERLNVRTPSVTGMLQKLAAQRPPFVIYEKHKGVRLTPAGKKRAWELLRHHRLLELFLHDVLKYSWDEVHDEAERLEHFISERFEDRVAAILGDPVIDPHGHLIPLKDQMGYFPSDVPLRQWPIDRPARVSSISDRSADLLREAERIGLRPGVVLRVERANSTASMLLRLAGAAQPARVSMDLANAISVESARPANQISRDRQS